MSKHNLRELVQRLSERTTPLEMPTVDEIEKAILNSDNQEAHEAHYKRYGEYDLSYLDRVVLLREIEVLRSRLAAAQTAAAFGLEPKEKK